MIQKRKKHVRAELLEYFHMLSQGYSYDYIQKKFGICSSYLKVQHQYNQESGLLKIEESKQHKKLNFSLKKKIVLDVENNHLTLHASSYKYGVSPQAISICLKKYRTEGLTSLMECKKRKIFSSMGRP